MEQKLLSQDDIAVLHAIGAAHREELLGVSTAASAADSDSVDEGSSPSPSAISEE